MKSMDDTTRTDNEKPKTFPHFFVNRTVDGAAAIFAEALTFHLFSIWTTQQAQGNTEKSVTIYNALKQTLQKNGVRGLYAGFWASALASTPGTMLFLYGKDLP